MVPKKNQNVNIFQKWGGVIPKFAFLKSVYRVKIGFKVDFFNIGMCFVKF